MSFPRTAIKSKLGHTRSYPSSSGVGSAGSGQLRDASPNVPTSVDCPPSGTAGCAGSKCCNPANHILAPFPIGATPSDVGALRSFHPSLSPFSAFSFAASMNFGTGSTRSTRSKSGRRTVEVTLPIPAPQSKARKDRRGAGTSGGEPLVCSGGGGSALAPRASAGGGSRGGVEVRWWRALGESRGGACETWRRQDAGRRWP